MILITVPKAIGNLGERSEDPIRALIAVPTRALASQSRTTTATQTQVAEDLVEDGQNIVEGLMTKSRLCVKNSTNSS